MGARRFVRTPSSDSKTRFTTTPAPSFSFHYLKIESLQRTQVAKSRTLCFQLAFLRALNAPVVNHMVLNHDIYADCEKSNLSI